MQKWFKTQNRERALAVTKEMLQEKWSEIIKATPFEGKPNVEFVKRHDASYVAGIITKQQAQENAEFIEYTKKCKENEGAHKTKKKKSNKRKRPTYNNENESDAEEEEEENDDDDDDDYDDDDDDVVIVSTSKKSKKKKEKKVKTEKSSSSSSSSSTERTEEEALRCVVCLSAPKRCLLRPCKHVCACKACTNELKNCPVCRKKIDNFEEVWL